MYPEFKELLMSKEAQTAFDSCPSRTVNENAPRQRTVVRCPKYPKGIEFARISEFDEDEIRGKSALRIGCLGCREIIELEQSDLLARLHTEIAEKCSGMYIDEHYPQAATQGNKAVKERLFLLTGYERVCDAFGKGGLYITGAAAEHVDRDYQEYAKFLLMAFEKARNVSVHTSSETATGSELGYEQLVLSSMAMHLLDNAIIKED
jgi:uncharacterized protein (TIGR02391 family)